jgi:hypothetical protein
MSTIRREPASEDYIAVERATILSGNWTKDAASENLAELQSLGQKVTRQNIDALLAKKKWEDPSVFLSHYSATESQRGAAQRDPMSQFVRMLQACNKQQEKGAKLGRAQQKAMKPYQSRRTSSE